MSNAIKAMREERLKIRNRMSVIIKEYLDLVEQHKDYGDSIKYLEGLYGKQTSKETEKNHPWRKEQVGKGMSLERRMESDPLDIIAEEQIEDWQFRK